MASYRSTEGEDRAKALVGVLLVHVALAFVILTGLNVRMVRQAVEEQLQTFDIKEPTPPTPEPPPPQQESERAKEDEGSAGKKADPSPIVAPKPKIVIPAKAPVVAAPVAGTGNSTTSGAALSGNGPGAGGSGSGRGGGGTGDFSGFTPARLIRNLSRRDYRSLAGWHMPNGSAVLAIGIDESGAMSQCGIARSSGDPTIDAGLCPLAAEKLRFTPARDDQGRRIPYRYLYHARWTL